MSKHNLILSKFNFLFKVIIDKYIQNIYTDKQCEKMAAEVTKIVDEEENTLTDLK